MGGNSSSNMASISKVVIPASGKHTATLIFLHGLGDTGHGWAETFSAVVPSYMKLICPTAPAIPVTLNAGMRMPAWFDLKGLEVGDSEDETGIRKACESIHQMIADEEKSGIASQRIMLGGFSQGGALALYSGLKFNKPLAGILAFSCWLPMNSHFTEGGVENKELPILQCHGQLDPVVQFRWGSMTSELLKKIMANAEFKSYRNMLHSSCDEELRDAKAFISQYLPAL